MTNHYQASKRPSRAKHCLAMPLSTWPSRAMPKLNLPCLAMNYNAIIAYFGHFVNCGGVCVD